MSDRLHLAQIFLKETGWENAQSRLLAGDASNRKYYRLTASPSGEAAVLMDAPPGKGEDVRPFIKIARYLSGIGLSAPRILAADESNGFLLLEDLGDDLFARVLVDDPTLEDPLYAAATDALIALHRQVPPPGLQTYDASTMSDMAALAFDWYTAGRNETARQGFHTTMHAILDRHIGALDVLIQRDYHAENLLWLPRRKGVARVGLLDFQDAMLGHPAYDLVSLLQDARRDVSAGIQRHMIARYVTATDTDVDGFEAAYRCLGAQRNLRILGVFARLCIRDGKPGYVELIPRVWQHLQEDLKHPALAPVTETLKAHLPVPTPQFLETLKKRCANAPTP